MGFSSTMHSYLDVGVEIRVYVSGLCHVEAGV
jgi:hypothetical protein